MSTIVDNGIELVTIWDGAHNGNDDDLFRQVAFVEKPAPLPVRAWKEMESQETISGRLMALLHEQPFWFTKALQAEAGIGNKALHTALQNFRRNGKTVHPERGVVQLVRSSQVAA